MAQSGRKIEECSRQQAASGKGEMVGRGDGTGQVTPSSTAELACRARVEEYLLGMPHLRLSDRQCTPM
eukprot:4420184-Amphidinium_carterae.2